jgi:toxin CptA
MGTALALLPLALICAATMGFAITRGATCMVAAVDEIYRGRGFRRILALAEAALWVAAGLSVAALAGLMPRAPAAHAIGMATILGGALLGIGAFVNRACVFGSVARLGAGEWHYLMTPLGFLAGCLVLQPLAVTALGAHNAMTEFPVLPAFVLLALLAFALFRGFGFSTAARRGQIADHLWSPHFATSVIGVAFVILLLAAGAWTYPEALIELSRGMTMQSALRVSLFLALLGGAALGGWGRAVTGGRGWSNAGAMRCLGGGILMGLGSLLIPGGNDNLILIGLPFLLPYAWVAIGVMFLSIWGCMALGDGLTRVLAPTKVES